MSERLYSRESPLTDVTVVDTDVHLTPGVFRDEIAAYMDEPWNRYTHPDTGDTRPNKGYPKSLGGQREFEIIDVAEPADIIEPLCNGFGVDYPIINPGSTGIESLYKTDWAVAEMRAFNDFLLDRFLDDNENFHGLAAVTASLAPDKAAEEIDRLADEDQIVGAYIQGQMHKPRGHPDLDVLYRALEDNDMTPAFHLSNMDREAPLIRESEKVMEWHAWAPPASGMLDVISLIANGVPAKFPDLNFVFLESGLGWVPGMMARLNREYGQWIDELPLLERTPEEYIKESFYFSSQPLAEFNDQADLLEIMKLIGFDSIMFSSDHPHYDFDGTKVLDKYLRQVSTEDRENVFAHNAIEAFGLDI